MPDFSIVPLNADLGPFIQTQKRYRNNMITKVLYTSLMK